MPSTLSQRPRRAHKYTPRGCCRDSPILRPEQTSPCCGGHLESGRSCPGAAQRLDSLRLERQAPNQQGMVPARCLLLRFSIWHLAARMHYAPLAICEFQKLDPSGKAIQLRALPTETSPRRTRLAADSSLQSTSCRRDLLIASEPPPRAPAPWSPSGSKTSDCRCPRYSERHEGHCLLPGTTASRTRQSSGRFATLCGWRETGPP